MCRTRKVEGVCSQQAWPPSSFLGSFLAKRPKRQLVMVANPGPRHEKHIAFICHFHHSWANLVKQTATLHGCTCTLCLHPGTAPKEHTKINRAVALSHEALSGTSRSHCLTLPLRRRLVFFHTAVVPSILYLHPSFSARLRQDQFVPSCVHPMLLGRKKKKQRQKHN